MTDRRYVQIVAAAMVLATVLRLPGLLSGYAMDDYAQLAMLGGVYPADRAIWDLFNFSSGDPGEVAALMNQGSLAWWSDPQLRMAGFRPLSSLLIAFDVAVFGHAPLAHHLHSLLWWCALVAGVAAVFRVLLPVRVAAVATVLFVLDESHTFPLAWLANRNALLSAAFGAWALWAHLRWRERGVRWGAWAAGAAMVASLGAGEYGLSAAAFILARELTSPDTGRSRFKAVLPAACAVLIYVAVHRLLGYGSQGSGVYLDPFRDPLAFLSTAAARIGVIAGDAFLAAPTGLVAFHPFWLKVQAMAGAVAFLVTVALTKWLSPDAWKQARFFALAFVLACVPMAGGFESSRMGLLPAPAAHGLLALIIVGGVERWRTQRHSAAGLVAVVLVSIHLVLAPIFGAVETRNVYQFNQGVARAALHSELADEVVERQRVVVLVAPDPNTLLYPRYIRWVHGSPLPRSWWVLSMSGGSHLVSRLDARTLELTALQIPMLASEPERLFRGGERPLRVGDQVNLDGLQITVMEGDAGRPRRVRFRFAAPLEDRRYRFVVPTPSAFVAYPVPALGEQKVIGPTRLPMRRGV